MYTMLVMFIESAILGCIYGLLYKNEKARGILMIIIGCLCISNFIFAIIELKKLFAIVFFFMLLWGCYLIFTLIRVFFEGDIRIIGILLIILVVGGCSWGIGQYYSANNRIVTVTNYMNENENRNNSGNNTHSSSSSGSGTNKRTVDPKKVYWTDGGHCWHSWSGCSSLSRSNNVHSGSLSKAKEEGKTNPCDLCCE